MTVSLNTSSSGLDKLHQEMSRQHTDALASFEQAAPVAKQIAESLKTAPRLLLLGMGASHWANRVVEAAYRKAGIDATAQPVSEYLRAPLPRGGRTVILTSQSGASGEIIRFLDKLHTPGRTFGLTLTPNSPLAGRVPSLIGVGGPEVAFAATRSLLISLVQHAAVLLHMGMPSREVEDLLDVLRNPITEQKKQPECIKARNELAQQNCIVFSSRNVLQGVADAGSLCIMELGRIPAFSLEGGQFRHGPCEMLKPGIGVVLLRPREDASDSIGRIARICLNAGITPVVFDLADPRPELDDLAECIKISLPPLNGLAGAAQALIAMQSVLVATAAMMVPDVGTPVRSTKVTDGE
jgi:fructoselysine-6-P-deglycase FrlB-like protein